MSEAGMAAVAARFAAGVLPVLGLLLLLVFLDSYQLLSAGRILLTLAAGAGAALACLAVNTAALRLAGADPEMYARFGAPVIEECAKAALVIAWIRARRIGFLVDAAILGFAAGAGFAFVENLFYARMLPDASPLVYVVRGFGTAVMHGGTTAVAGILARRLADRRPADKLLFALPGLALAVAIHIAYNASLLSPVANTAVLLIVLPAVLAGVFQHSERALHHWLGEGFDQDVDLLAMLAEERFQDSPAGVYLRSLRSSFPPPVVADMLCALQLSAELAIRAKAELLKREAGFPSAADPAVRERFREWQYLERSMGRTGRRALAPLLPSGSREVWQVHLLGDL